jgi:3-(3-hydroxy-phenyl)propionate hydroxylase
MMVIGDDIVDSSGRFTERFDARPGSAYLLRPDQHLCARWRSFDAGKVRAARLRALGN